MSWDIIVLDLPESAKSIGDIPDDFVPGPIGQRSEIITRILDIVPFADFSDPSWGRIDHPEFSIEVSMDEPEAISGFCFIVRGGDSAALMIADILNHLGLRALDPSSPTGIFDLQGGSLDGLKKWRDYRDQIVGR